MPTTKSRLNISLSNEMKVALRKLAMRDRVPEATKAVRLIETALETEEDQIWDTLAAKRDAKKTRSAIENKLTAKPEVFGKPLRRSLKGYWKLRVGDYRIIYRIEKIKVKIFMIQHRSVVYGRVIKRV